MNGTKCQEDDIVISEASIVSLSCSYHDFAIYTWYLDDIRLPQFGSSTADIPIDLGVHTVKCSALINGSDGCYCSDFRTINVTALGMTLHPINRTKGRYLLVVSYSHLLKT